MRVKLTENVEIPRVGFGTYLIKDADASALVQTAIHNGYRHVDTAEGYENETGVGRGIESGMKESGLTREEIFVTTKLWPGNEAWGQTPKTYDSTIESLNASLSRLGLDYVDLYLIHTPFAAIERLEQWRALVELHAQGKARAVGVSNYLKSHIEEIRTAGLPLPCANQLELHPWSQKPQLVGYLAENSILPIAYSSLVPLSSWRNAEDQASAKTESMRAEGESVDSPFRKMAKKYGVTEAQVLLRWGLQNGYPVLPKSSSETRMKINLDLFCFEIDDEDLAAIASMDRGHVVAWHTGDPSQVD